MSTVPGWDHVIFILVTTRNVSLGMGLLAVHDAVRRLQEMPLRASAPRASNRTREPLQQAFEPATSTVAPPYQARRVEPARDPASDLQHQRERDFETRRPQEAESGRPESRPAPLAQTPTPETAFTPDPVPAVATPQPAPPPAASPTPPGVEAVEAPQTAEHISEEPDADEKRYYRGVVVGGSDEDSSRDVPIGPRARMFFKRNDRDSKKNRKWRS